MSWGVTDLCVAYGGKRALDQVSWAVPPATITGVVGGDGAGKSTLLKALTGAVRPQSGEVDRPDERHIGYVPAGTGVYTDLTVDENLAFFGAAYGLRSDAFAAAREDFLKHTDLTAARARLAGNLSGGMRRKLALGMAMLHKPQMLVLDEPTTGVDPVSRAELWELIAQSTADGAAVAVSTTYLDEAERASSVLVLEEGQPLAQGTPDTIIAKIPGAVTEQAQPGSPEHSWRHGPAWRVWTPQGAPPEGSQPVDCGLEDAIIVAELANTLEGGRAP